MQKADMKTKAPSAGGLFFKPENDAHYTLRFFDGVYGPYEVTFADGETANRYGALVLVRGPKPAVQAWEFGPMVYNFLVDYSENPKWGDLKEYDVDVCKSVKGKKTSYAVIAEPKEKLNKDDEAAISSHEIDVSRAFKQDGVAKNPDTTTGYDLLLELITAQSWLAPTAWPKGWLPYVAQITDEAAPDAVSKVNDSTWRGIVNNWKEKLAKNKDWKPSFLAEYDPFVGQ